MKLIINSLIAKYLARNRRTKKERYRAIVGRDLTCVNFPAGYGKRRCSLIASWSRGRSTQIPFLSPVADPQQDAARSCRMRKLAISL